MLVCNKSIGLMWLLNICVCVCVCVWIGVCRREKRNGCAHDGSLLFIFLQEPFYVHTFVYKLYYDTAFTFFLEVGAVYNLERCLVS